MKSPFDEESVDVTSENEHLREKIIGLGKTSAKKSYYPTLQKHLATLERFQSLIDQSNEFIFFVEVPSGRITYVNSSACSRLSFTKTQLLQKYLKDLIPTSSFQELHGLLSYEGGDEKKNKIFVTVLNPLNGKSIPVELNLQIIRFNKEVYGIIIARDISEKKLADQLSEKINQLEALNRQLNYRIQLEELVSTLSSRFIEASYEKTDEIMIWGLEKIGKFLDIDRCYLLQLLPDHRYLLLKYAWCRYSIEPLFQNQQQLPTEPIAEILKMLQVYDVFQLSDMDQMPDSIMKDDLIKNKIQSLFYVPLMYQNTLIGFLGADSIKCRSKLLSEEIRLFKIIGEIILNTLKRKEMEDDLKQSKMASETANLAKSDFLSNMSHEIRTPMNAIIGLSNLALKTELTEKQADYLIKIEYSARSLLGIINDILDFSKIESGKLGIEKIDFNLEDVLLDLTTLICIKTEEKGVEFLFNIAPDVPIHLKGDPLRLGQVLLNLSNNAYKFTHQGQIILKIELPESSQFDLDNQVVIAFSVQDTGIGMTPDQIEKLFKPFFQGDASTTREYGGTGLGLTISKNLVEMMDGEIWVKSEYGKGSTFGFTAKFDLQSTKLHKHYQCPDDLKGMRVLIVEDSAVCREILTNLLSPLEFDVHQANSGLQAIEKIRNSATSNPYQLVLMDFKMPGLDGIEVSKKIKMELGLCHPPAILMVTAYDQDEIRQNAKAVGVDSFLKKPVIRSILFDTIMTVFGKSAFPKPVFRPDAKEIKGLERIKGAKILLVEDNDINQQVAVELLESQGFWVTVANNGKEAIQQVSSSLFDCVLMDVNMPVMDGFTATQAIRNTIDRHLPIVAMTAHAVSGYREKCLETGMNDYVTKPIYPQKLLEALLRHIQPKERTIPEIQQSSSASVPDIDFPIQLTGFDLERGLSLLAGKKKVFLDLLIKFKHTRSDSLQIIKNAIKTSNLQQAEFLIHTIKGMAGNLGATKLHDAALALEKVVKTGQQTEIQNHVDQFAAAFEEVMRSIGSIESGLENSAQVASCTRYIDSDKLKADLKEIGELITCDYAATLKKFEVIETYVKNTTLQADFKNLKQLIEDFEEKKALDFIRQIRSGL